VKRKRRRSGRGARRRSRNRHLAKGWVVGPRLQQHVAHSHPLQLAPAASFPCAVLGVGHAHVSFPAPAAYWGGFVVSDGSSSSRLTTWLLPPPRHAAPPVSVSLFGYSNLPW
jgi:hypothetical protein